MERVAGEREWIGIENFTILKPRDGGESIVLGGIWDVDYVYRSQDGEEKNVE